MSGAHSRPDHTAGHLPHLDSPPLTVTKTRQEVVQVPARQEPQQLPAGISRLEQTLLGISSVNTSHQDPGRDYQKLIRNRRERMEIISAWQTQTISSGWRTPERNVTLWRAHSIQHGARELGSVCRGSDQWRRMKAGGGCWYFPSFTPGVHRWPLCFPLEP